MDPQPFTSYNRNIPYMSLKKGILLFRFQDIKHGEIAFHSYKGYQLMLILNGEVTIQTEEKSFPARPGTFMICPPEILHTTKIPEETRDYHRFVLHVDTDLYLDALDDIGGDFHLPFDGEDLFTYDFDYPDLAPLVTAMESLYTHGNYNDAYTRNGYRRTLSEILLMVERDSLKHKAETNYRLNTLAILARDMIQKEYKDPLLTLESIANRLYINKSYLARVFRDLYHETVYQKIIDLRLNYVVEQLMQGIAVKEAYLEAGFSDYSSFLKSFKKAYGVTPTQYVQNSTK